MPPLLEASNVSRQFLGVTALDRVSLTLQAGEIHALVGENGAGKSTLIGILSGVVTPDNGRILFQGAQVRIDSPHDARKLGIITVHQEPTLFPTLSVAENMAFADGLPTTTWGRVDWKRVRESARRATDLVDASIDVRASAERLSIAERHLVQLATAMANEPRLLILDEPTSSLSGAESERLFDRLQELRQHGAAILYVSHRQPDIFRLADRITVLRDGQRVWHGVTGNIDRSSLVEAMVGRERAPLFGSRTISAETPAGATPLLKTVGFTDARGRFTDVDLVVHPREVVGLYGLTGSGRTEWAQVVAGLRKRSKGKLEVNGQEIVISSPREAIAAGIAYLPEDRLHQGILPNLSVRQNTVLANLRQMVRWCLVRGSAEKAATDDIRDELQIKMEDPRQPIAQLSGGNQQKVVLGRWLLTQPKVFLLDEPTRGIDIASKAEIHQLIRQLANSGCAVILISSDLPEVMDHTDRVVVFRDGKAIKSYPARETSALAIGDTAIPSGDDDQGHRRQPRTRRRTPWALASEGGLSVAIVLLGLLLAWTNGQFLTGDNLLQVLSNASVLSVMGIGSAVVILAGGIDISVGSLLGLSAGVAGLILGLPGPAWLTIPLAIVMALATGFAGGCLNATLSLLGRIHPIVVTLGTMTLFRGLLQLLTGGRALTNIPPAFESLVTGRLLGVEGAIVIMALVATLTGCWLQHTKSGRSLYAIGSSRTAARVVGLSRWRLWLLAFGAGGLCAGLAGLMELAQTGTMQTRLGMGYELRAIAAAVVGGVAITGGRGTVIGVLLGAILLALVQNALVFWQVGVEQNGLVMGLLLLAAVVLQRLVRTRIS
ncbi:Ribose import ATP-binding protein RbsA [Planctomycetes bacterium Pan216]|uniref:Ribose import ATP-binding protein RbsA n=1 Tax=Kolteria novifilia TaxID=2527975 RepID=A0A518AWU5_9BACT|nr:Ribose import ATP-binding protein RbsA [Planctomycetes bacterium Pan216]